MFLRLLVVSTETYGGGLKVNEVRHQSNLSTLDICTVDLLEAVPEYTDEEEEEGGGGEEVRRRSVGGEKNQ